MILTPNAEAYIRSLNGECIPMSFAEAQAATNELKDTGLVLDKGYIQGLTPEGRVISKRLKR